MKNPVAEAINNLKKDDVTSLLLFALYKIKEIPEYSTLSELAYLLDEKSLGNLLDYYGGMTIRIPTKQELKVVSSALLVYQFTKIDNIKLTSALKIIGEENSIPQRELLDIYSKLVGVLDNYEFKTK